MSPSDGEAQRPASVESVQALAAAMKDADPILGALHSSICLFDREGRILACNRATRDLLNRSDDEILGRRCHEVFHHRSLPISGCPFTLARKTLRPESVEMVLAGRWSRVTVTPVLERGECRGAIHVLSDISKRKEARAQSRETGQLLEKTFASLREAAFILDAATTKIVECNQAASRIFGYDRREMLGRTTAFLHVDDASLSLFRGRLAEAIKKEGVLREFEFRMKRKDGTVFPTVHNVQQLEDEQGARAGWVSFVSDITARKQTQEALRESEAGFRSAFENGAIGMALVAPDGRTLQVNSAFCRMVGYTEAELVNRPFTEITHPDDLSVNVPGWQRMIRGETLSFRMEKRYIRKDGGVVWGDMSTTAMRDAKGQPLYQITHVQDITERKRAEEALRESEASLRALYENNLVGILLAAPDGKTFAANPAACRILGRTEEEICNRGRAGFMLRHDPRVAAFLAERARTGTARGEVTMIRGDRKRFPAEVASVLFQTAAGPRVCTVIQDISDRNAAEEQARELTRRLLTVREEEKRRLSAALHHDVGSMTVGVTARMHAAEEDLRAGDTRQALAALRECRAQFDRSIVQLKALAVALRPPDLDVLGLSAAVRHHLLQLSRDTPLRIRFTDATHSRVVKPEVQTVLFRVAQECLNNVVEHAQARRVTVRLYAGKRGVRLSIVDDGKGFDLSSAAGPVGTRIGLRAVREMVTALGGQLTVNSAPGKGTTVRVVAPAAS